METVNSGWCFSLDHQQLCRVIETQTPLGQTACRVWLPGIDCAATVLLPSQEKRPWGKYSRLGGLAWPLPIRGEDT